MSEKKLGYIGGDIMSFGSNLARRYEYDEFIKAGLPVDVYSPVMNKSINDKSSVTEEENNHLAEKITEADINRLWNSDFVVMCPEQSAIGSLCEMGCVYGWHYMAQRLFDLIMKGVQDENKSDADVLMDVAKEIDRVLDKRIFAHYFDIRNTTLNENGFRRSFGINQLLYGMILDCTADGELHKSFDEIMPLLKELYGGGTDGRQNEVRD